MLFFEYGEGASDIGLDFKETCEETTPATFWAHGQFSFLLHQPVEALEVLKVDVPFLLCLAWKIHLTIGLNPRRDKWIALVIREVPDRP